MNISSFVRTVDKLKLRCEGVVVLRHGEKVAEYRWVPEKPRNSFSVSKSFVAVAVGMAVDRQKLSLASRAVDFFPEVRNPAPRSARTEVPLCKPGKALSSLTLEHLLTMTRGHATFSRPATVAEALAQPLAYRPGERFVYDNGSTFLASAMFTRAMGINVRGFLLKELFKPLGIDTPEWEESPDGHTVGATGLMLTTGALARFGQFLLQKGEWHQEQLMSAAWIESASRPHVGTGMRLSDRDLGYGYCFWPCRHGAYRADGKLGQFVVILPLRDAVVAVNSDETKPYPVLDAVWNEILPLL